jgi:hypothetical protein
MANRVARWVLAACAACAIASAANAVPIVIFATGVDAGGIALPNGTTPDPHYTLVSVPAGSSDVTLVRSGASGFPIPPWIQDSSVSRWIKPNNEAGVTCDFCTDPEGDYVYRTTFDLTGLDPAAAILTGRWATDDGGIDILINGIPTGILSNAPPQPYEAWTRFRITSGFVADVNTLDFVVHNTAGFGNPTGLRVEISGTVGEIPEPAAFVLIGAGLVALGVVRRHGPLAAPAPTPHSAGVL